MAIDTITTTAACGTSPRHQTRAVQLGDDTDARGLDLRSHPVRIAIQRSALGGRTGPPRLLFRPAATPPERRSGSSGRLPRREFRAGGGAPLELDSWELVVRRLLNRPRRNRRRDLRSRASKPEKTRGRLRLHSDVPRCCGRHADGLFAGHSSPAPRRCQHHHQPAHRGGHQLDDANAARVRPRTSSMTRPAPPPPSAWRWARENSGGGASHLIEQWNGTTWTVVPSANAPATTEDAVNSASCAGTVLLPRRGGIRPGRPSPRCGTHGLVLCHRRLLRAGARAPPPPFGLVRVGHDCARSPHRRRPRARTRSSGTSGTAPP